MPELRITKRGHRYVWRYPKGKEPNVLSDIRDLIADPNSPLDVTDGVNAFGVLFESLAVKPEVSSDS